MSAAEFVSSRTKLLKIRRRRRWNCDGEIRSLASGANNSSFSFASLFLSASVREYDAEAAEATESCWEACGCAGRMENWFGVVEMTGDSGCSKAESALTPADGK